MNESLALARNIVQVRYDDLPRPVVETTKKSVLDAIGVTLAAGTLGEGCRPFVELAVEEGGKRASTILGFDAKVPPAKAAFANGSMAHALDFEDAHDRALVHPNAATLPAALAVAESIGHVDGREFLAAMALGSDLVCRLGLALNEDLLHYGWYMPPILGAFGATAAAGRLLRLSAEQMVDALALTLCQATCSAQLTQSTTSFIRSIRDAFAAQAGVQSALLAQRGVAGFEEPIEGKAGLYQSYARGNYDPSKLTNELGETFEGGNISFKPWPSCRGTHAYIDAALQIRKEHRLPPHDVDEIHLRVSSVNRMLCEPVEAKQRPQTAIDAKFSLPFCVATALQHGQVTLDRFTPAALNDREVLELARRVTYEVDERLGRKDATQGLVQISSGSAKIARQVDVPLGHPQNPISDDALVSKFMDCAGHSVKSFSAEDLSRVAGLVLNLEQLDDIRELTEIL